MKKPLESGFDEPAPSGPALDRHEASRKAFEALHTNDTHHRSSRGKYLDLITRERWDAWCEALDHAAQEQPAPNGSAVGWVKERLYKANGRNLVLDENDALELARRCDAAEAHNKSLAKMLATTLIERDQARTMFRNHNDQLADEQNQFGLLKGELHTTKAKLAAAERRVERLRDVLGWYAGELRFCNSMSREGDESRDRLAKDRGNRAIDALAETEEDASNE